MPRPLIVTVLAVVLAATAVAVADARFLSGRRTAVAGNPADSLAGQPIDRQVYDSPRRCDARPRPGTQRLVAWLKKYFRGTSYGVYRCDGGLHSDWRAIDWGLDARNAVQKREGTRLIRLLLAPDRRGTPRALARRMGIQELIWDCSYWSTSSDRAGAEFRPYSVCGRGTDPTQAHIDHIHIGITIAGSRGLTSFWRARADAIPVPRNAGTPPATTPPSGGTPAG